MPPATMISMQFDRYGDPSVLQAVEVPVPAIGPTDVLIEMRATAVAPHDASRRRGEHAGPGSTQAPLPYRPGANAAGVVVVVGDRVDNVAVGDHVATMSKPACGQCWYCRRGKENLCDEVPPADSLIHGTCAQYFVGRAAQLLVAPKHIPFEKLGVCVWAYSTAWNMAVDHAGIEPGDDVLVTAASGSIGLAAMQLARLQGARRTIAVSNSPGKVARLKELGADAVIDTSSHDIVTEAKRLTDGQGVSVVLDCVGGSQFVAGLRSLRKGGRLVNIARLGGNEVSFNLGEFFPRGITLFGTRGATRAAQEKVLQLLAGGRIDPVIHTVLPLKDAAEGHRLMETGQAVGRIVLVP